MSKKQVKVIVKENNEEREYDQLEQSKSSCSLWMVLLSLVLILIVLVIAFFLSKKFFVDFKMNVKPKIEHSVISVEGKMRIRINEDDINQLIGQNIDLPLKEPKATINTDGITITGKSSDSIFSLRVTVILVPIVKDGKLDYEIKSIKTSGLEAPKMLKEKLNTFKLSSPQGIQDIEVESVGLYNGFLEVVGKEK